MLSTSVTGVVSVAESSARSFFLPGETSRSSSDARMASATGTDYFESRDALKTSFTAYDAAVSFYGDPYALREDRLLLYGPILARSWTADTIFRLPSPFYRPRAAPFQPWTVLHRLEQEQLQCTQENQIANESRSGRSDQSALFLEK